jgi:hypothetical protein
MQRHVRHSTMSASGDSNATKVNTSSEHDAPNVEALFLIKFDNKVGYALRQPGTHARAIADHVN